MVSEIGNRDFLHFSCLSDLKNNSVYAFLYYPKVSGIKIVEGIAYISEKVLAKS